MDANIVIKEAFLTLAMSLICSVAVAQDLTVNDDYAMCRSAADTRIEACSRVLDAEMRSSAQRRAIALTYRSRGWISKGDIERSVIDLTEAISFAIDFAPAYEARADILRANGQCDLAIADYSEAIRLLPNRAALRINRSVCLLRLNKKEDAVIDLDEAIKLDTANKDGIAVSAFNLKGRLESENRNFDQAIAYFSEAIKLDPSRFQLLLDRGSVWSAKGEDVKALADYDEAIKLDASNETGAAVFGWIGKAKLFTQTGDRELALAAYSEAIRLDPKQASLYLERASLRSAKGDGNGAISDYEEAIKADPMDGEVFAAYGNFLRDRNDYENAIKHYDQAIKLQPDLDSLYGNRALTHFLRGDLIKAALDFKRVVDSQQNAYSTLLLYLSQAQAKDGEKRAREELTRNAKKLQTGVWPYPVIDLFLGKKTPDAILASADSDAKRCEAQFYAGHWHLIRGANSLGKAALQAAANICPKDFIEYSGAVAQLNRLN